LFLQIRTNNRYELFLEETLDLLAIVRLRDYFGHTKTSPRRRR